MKIIIVDENDNPVGLKDRGLDASDIYRVAALWLTNSKGEFLLARRAYNKSHNPGQWGPAVAGTVEEGETYDSNIIKETEEELGIKITLADLKLGPKMRIVGKHNHFTQWYFLKMDIEAKDIKFQVEEVAEVKWFSRQAFEQELNDHPTEFLASMRNKVFDELIYEAEQN